MPQSSARVSGVGNVTRSRRCCGWRVATTSHRRFLGEAPALAWIGPCLELETAPTGSGGGGTVPKRNESLMEASNKKADDARYDAGTGSDQGARHHRSATSRRAGSGRRIQGRARRRRPAQAQRQPPDRDMERPRVQPAHNRMAFQDGRLARPGSEQRALHRRDAPAIRRGGRAGGGFDRRGHQGDDVAPRRRLGVPRDRCDARRRREPRAAGVRVRPRTPAAIRSGVRARASARGLRRDHRRARPPVRANAIRRELRARAERVHARHAPRRLRQRPRRPRRRAGEHRWPTGRPPAENGART